MPPEISVVIVNWNGIDFLPDCLNSLLSNPPDRDFEVVVVDNASSDGSAEWLESKLSSGGFEELRLRLIRSGENLGFGKANNLAFAGTDSKYLLLLNPDAKVLENSIDDLVRALEGGERIGIVGPRLLNSDMSLQTSVWPHPPSALGILVDGLKLTRVLPKRLRSRWLLGRHWDHDEPRNVPSMSGAVMLVSRELIQEIGGFDPALHMYGEDADLCHRCIKAGYGVFFEPTAEFIHLGGQSTRQRWDEFERRYMEERAQLNFHLQTLSPFQSLRITLARTLVLYLYMFRRILTGGATKELSDLVSLQRAGVLDSAARLWGRKRSDSLEV